MVVPPPQAQGAVAGVLGARERRTTLAEARGTFAAHPAGLHKRLSSLRPVKPLAWTGGGASAGLSLREPGWCIVVSESKRWVSTLLIALSLAAPLSMGFSAETNNTGAY